MKLKIMASTVSIIFAVILFWVLLPKIVTVVGLVVSNYQESTQRILWREPIIVRNWRHFSPFRAANIRSNTQMGAQIFSWFTTLEASAVLRQIFGRFIAGIRERIKSH